MRNSLTLLTVLLSVGLAGWCGWHYAGPYKWAAEAQGAVFGTHWVQLSFILACVFFGVPAFFVAGWIDKRLGPADPHKEMQWAQLEALTDGWHGKMLMVGLAGAAMFGWLGYRDATAGPLTTVDLASIEGGQEPPSLYVDLVGAHPVEAATITFGKPSEAKRFVPLVAGDGVPVVFAKVWKDGKLDDPVRGQLEEDGLPGEVRTAYEGAGAVGERHYVLHVGKDPSKNLGLAKGAVAVGLLLAAVGFGVGYSRLPGHIGGG